MKALKISGLVVPLAVLVTAFVGVSTAAAGKTIICKVHQEPCAAGNVATIEHLIDEPTPPADEISFTVLGVKVTIACEESLMLVTPLVLDDPLVEHITGLTSNKCTRVSNGAACTITAVKLGLIDLSRGLLNSGSAIFLNHSMKVECSGLPTCTYGGEPVLEVEGALNTAGAGNGMMTAKGATLTVEGGGFCPATAKWTALYAPLVELFIVS